MQAYTFHMGSLGTGDQLLALSAQGLLNRTGPTLFALWDQERVPGFHGNKYDRQWIDYLAETYDIEFTSLRTLEEVLSLVPQAGAADGYVLWDIHVPDTKNVATNLAGVEGWLIALPEHEPLLQSLGWRKREDLRGRFRGQSREQIYRWAYDRCFDRSHPSIVACLDVEQKFFHDLTPYLEEAETIRIRVTNLKTDGVETGAELKQVAVLQGLETLASIDVDSPSANMNPVGDASATTADLPEHSFFRFDLERGSSAELMIYARGIYAVAIAANDGPWEEVCRKDTPFFQGGYTHFIDAYIRDFCIANKAFCFSLGADDSLGEEFQLREAIMERIAPHGGTVLGWHCDRDTELDHLVTCSRRGNVVMCCGNACSMSFAQHLSPESLRVPEPPPAPALEKDKVYLSFIVGDGDALWSTYSFNGNFFNHPSRGSHPFGWGLQMHATELCPAYFGYYLDHATPNDAFVASASGVGYSYLDVMEPDVLRRHLRRSRPYFERTGIRAMQVYLTPRECGGPGLSQEQIRIIAEELGDILDGAIEGYWGYNPPADVAIGDFVYTYVRLPDVTIWGGPRPENFRKAMEQMVSCSEHRPLFIATHPWIEEMPIEDTSALIDSLGDDYRVVRPDHFLHLMVEANRG